MTDGNDSRGPEGEAPEPAAPDSPPGQFGWVLALQIALYVAVALNVLAVRLESHFFRLAGEPMRYWRRFPLEPSLAYEQLVFWSSVAGWTALAHVVLGFLTAVAAFAVTGWNRRLLLLSSLVFCVLALGHQLMNMTCLD